ncbi:MAG: hypothetical protein Q4G42_07710 [Neisseria sp.]|nr:hypothetical protein [Neisseria sp.]
MKRNHHLIKCSVFALACAVLVACAHPTLSETQAADVLPNELVGTWVGSGAQLDEGLSVQQGAVLYLRADGSGMSVAAAPPIGMMVRTRYDAAKRQLFMELCENDQCHPLPEPLVVDLEKKTLYSAQQPEHIMRKYSDQLPDFVRARRQ